MIVGIGVDLVDLERFEAQLAKNPNLLERVFHPIERSYSPRKLAGSWAAKEAVIKAVGEIEGISLRELSVVRDSLGKPWLNAEGSTAQRLKRAGIAKLHLSLSHDGGMLVAYVIAEGAASLQDGEGGFDA